MPEVVTYDDCGLCQKVRNLEALGISQDEILRGARFPRTMTLFQNGLFLAHHKRMSALTEPWQLNPETGRVLSHSVMEELESYVQRNGDIKRMDYIHNAEDGIKALAGLKLAVDEALKSGEDLTLEALDVYFMRENMGNKEFRDHVGRYQLASTEEEIRVALDRVERYNLF